MSIDVTGAREKLAVARRLVHEPSGATAGLWPRAAAMLARQALETVLADFWQSFAPGLERTSFRTQLLCLPQFLSSRLSGRVSHAWWALSRACHYHPYDLAPASVELSRWLDDVRDLLGEIEQLSRHRARPTGG